MATKFLRILITIIFLTICSMPVAAINDKDILKVGIVIDGPWKNNFQYMSLIKSEIMALTRDEFDVRFPEDQQIEGNWDIGRINNGVTKLLASSDVDLILTLGVIANHVIFQSAN